MPDNPSRRLERAFLRRIMFYVDARQTSLCSGQEVQPVVVPLRLVLKQDDVELLYGDRAFRNRSAIGSTTATRCSCTSLTSIA
jgi:hypothetical protein